MCTYVDLGNKVAEARRRLLLKALLCIAEGSVEIDDRVRVGDVIVRSIKEVRTRIDEG
jgi:hypothetical protein